ncbi:MAG: universal stress protein [Ignavibacteria bacterium]|nr:universal stress protein [Ignavibacteria bacterium]
MKLWYNIGTLRHIPINLPKKSTMFTVKTLLVPTDFSENATKALGMAKEIAKGTKAVIHLIHIVEPVVYPADWSYAQVGFADIEQELFSNAERELTHIATVLRADGFTVVTGVKRGRASDEICNYAAEQDISIVCIGTHGRSGFEHFLFGSTTERVLRSAPCPVLSVRLKETISN